MPGLPEDMAYAHSVLYLSKQLDEGANHRMQHAPAYMFNPSRHHASCLAPLVSPEHICSPSSSAPQRWLQVSSSHHYQGMSFWRNYLTCDGPHYRRKRMANNRGKLRSRSIRLSYAAQTPIRIPRGNTIPTSFPVVHSQARNRSVRPGGHVRNRSVRPRLVHVVI